MPQLRLSLNIPTLTKTVSLEDVTNEIKSFFHEEAVFRKLANAALIIDMSNQYTSRNIQAVRTLPNYRKIQAAFVLEALGVGSYLLSDLKRDTKCEDLIRDWNDLCQWLVHRLITKDVVRKIRSMMAVHRELNPPQVRGRHILQSRRKSKTILNLLNITHVSLP